MKLCVSTLACPGWDLPRIVETCAINGIAGIDFRGLGGEIDVTRLPQFGVDLPKTMGLLRQHGLRIPCLNTSVALLASGDAWKHMLDECQRTGRLAERTGTRMMRVFGGSIPEEMSRNQATSMAARRLRQLVKLASRYSCCVLIETHDDWTSPNDLAALLDGFDPLDAAILWDCEHTTRAGHSPSDVVGALGDRIRHVHLKDSVRQDLRSVPRLVGQGDLPISDCVRALHKISYDGWLCLDTDKRWCDAAPEPELSIPQFAGVIGRLLDRAKH
ncbi:MAG: sugar phosphate isomerase/epimerase family protein [Tepidisphaeraceae bacterium]